MMPRKRSRSPLRRATGGPLSDEVARLLLDGVLTDSRGEFLQRDLGSLAAHVGWVHEVRASLGFASDFHGEPDEIATLWRAHRAELREAYLALHGDSRETRRAFAARMREVLEDEREFLPVRAARERAREVAVRAAAAGLTPTAWRARCAAEGREP